jgi:hypothetical protein
MRVSGEIILENVCRYRATASLYRQTAAFRPLQSGLFWSKPNGGTVSPWPNSKTILSLTAQTMTKICKSLHTRTRDVRWLPPRESSHASGLTLRYFNVSQRFWWQKATRQRTISRKPSCLIS